MKRIAILLTLCSSLAFAEPAPEALKEADKLAEVLGLKSQMEASFEAMLPMIETQAKQLKLTEDQNEEMKEIYRAWFEKDFDHEGLSKKIVVLYANTFTIQELKDLTKFYKTPLGQKTLKSLPSLVAEGARLGMIEGQKKEGALLKRLQPLLDKLEK